MKKLSLQIKYTVYASEQELEAGDARLLKAAKEAADKAYAPYSGFKVGAAALLENGEVVCGNNQENAAYPSGLCAERVALFAASATYPGVPVLALAITARSGKFTINEPVSPCGACRQVMAEYESLYKKDMRLLLSGEEGEVMVLDNISGVLPFKFDASQLNKK
jgi:cytidine deaminase